MKSPIIRRRMPLALIFLACAAACANAQWLKQAVPGLRTADGKSDLSAPVPRTADGTVDLSGIWMAEASPFPELMRLLPGGQNGVGENVPSKYFIDILADFGPEESPLRPAEVAAFRHRAADFGKDFPVTHCQPAGVPNAELMPVPYKIVQTSQLVVMLYEGDTSFRQVFLDGRKPLSDPQPTWRGYSVGKWEGETLVVDTTGFNDRGWLDAFGHIHSEALHVTERFHRRDFGHIDVDIRIEDPQTFTRPFTIKVRQQLQPDTEILESFCTENEKDLSHIVGR